MDFLKSVGSIIFTILAMVCMFAGIINDSFIVGFLGAIVCLVISFAFLSGVSSETWKAANELEKQKKHNKLHGGYKCPNCGMNAGHEIGALSKAASVSAFGLASNKIGKNYECANCNYKW